MGFLDFVDDAWSSIKSVPQSAWETTKGVVSPITGYLQHDIVEPTASFVGNDIVKPVANVAARTVQTTENIVEHVANKADRLLEAGVSATEGLSNLLSSPYFTLAVMALGAYVLVSLRRG